MITPFRIDVPEADLDDLRARLRRTRWPEPEPVGDWSQGTPLAVLREFCEYWAVATTGAARRPGSTDFRSTAPKSTAWACTSCTCVRRTRTRCRWC